TVEFEQAVRAAAGDGLGVFIEVSPHPVLNLGLQETFDAAGSEAVALGTLRRDEDEAHRFMTSLAEAHVHGVGLDWQAVFAGQPTTHVDLPTYPFQHQQFWPEAREVSVAGTADPVDAEFWDVVERGDLEALAETLELGGATRDSLGEVLPVLSSWRRQRRDESTLDAWRYRVTWKPVTAAAPVLSGSWLLVVPAAEADHETVRETVRGLTRHGADVSVFTVSGTEADRGILAARLADEPEPAGVVSLLALLQGPDPEHPVMPAGLAANVELVKALGDAGRPAPLWCLTRSAVSVGRSDGPVRTEQAMNWGFGRVVALEHPERWGGLIDLPEILDDRAWTRICGVLSGGEDAEDQVAVRASGVFGRRLQRARSGQGSTGARWTPRGTVLITGGTGALGSFIAHRLVDQGAEHVVLTSRRGAHAPGARELEERLTALGARVTLAACDVADRDVLAATVQGLRDAGDRITAVVHAAGVGQLSVIDETSRAEYADVLRAKVLGAAHLHEVFGDEQLDAFILFSSISGIWGSGGQGAYGAANAYLDALAQQRRAVGLAATAMSWGAWGGAGMAKGSAEEILSRRGLPVMDPELAIDAMQDAVGHDETMLTVADVRWERFVPTFTVARPSPLLADLPEVRRILDDAAAVEAAETGDLSAFQRSLAELPENERPAAVLDLVRTEAAAVLGLADAATLEANRAFRELGFDSLTAVEVRNRLKAATGLRLSTTLVFDYPTATVLAEHLLAESLGHGDDTAVTAPAGAAADDDPIVIVGMGCRFPGDVRTPEQLWDLAATGTDAISGFPADRGWERAFADDGSGPGFTPMGGFLNGAAAFDAGFFGISPREALAMDPQQRLLLETSWEAFERSGIVPAAVRGSSTGVFIGASSQGYASDVHQPPEGVEGYLLTGTATAVISGRIAYALGLEGPAVTIDTACSSSLVALHLAAQALRQGECSMALAGGAAIMATPAVFAEFSRQGGLSSDGRCKAFAEAADGTGWGEGVGVLLLERLSDAERNGHRVLAVVRGSAINQDGASNGISAPNGPSQQRVIRQALVNAGLTADQVDAVEAHGTGTTLGDPIEAQAVLTTYGRDRDGRLPLLLGSLKSNIGHTQAAAGVAGIIKMVMALGHGVLPRTLHVDEPSTHVDWTEGAVELLTERRDWPETGHPRRCGISSFGVSGTNAHVILEQAPEHAPAAVAPPAPRTQSGPAALPWVLSARDEEALRDQAERLRTTVVADPGLDSLDVAYSLATTRSVHEHRAVVVATDRDAFLDGLVALAEQGTAAGLVREAGARGRVGVLFSGQGSQRAGMGRELYEAYPVFADAFDAVCAELDRYLDRPLREVVFDGGELLDQTQFTQAGLFALEVALFELVTSWGVKPDFLLGHSIGELSAAYVAGVLSLEDAAALVAARGRLMQALPTDGEMVSLQAAEDEVLPLLTDGVSIAALNGPRATVISGDEDAVLAIAAHFEGEGRKTKRLRVSHAFHSPRMDAMLDDFRKVAQGLTFNAPQLAIVCDVTGEVLSAEEVQNPEYWVRHVREAVRFLDGIRTLEAAGVTAFLELGPDGVLSAMAQDCVTSGSAESTFVPALRKNRDEPDALLTALAELHVRGKAVDWSAYFSEAGAGARRVDLPTYAFQHGHYWLEGGAAAGDVRAAGLGTADHPLLGAAVELGHSDEHVFTGRLSLDSHPWLADHTVMGTVLMPGTAFVELAVKAGDDVGCDHLEELTIEAPLILSPEGAVGLQLWVGPADEAGRRAVEIHSRDLGRAGAAWTRHASGTLTSGGDRPAAGDLTVWPPEGATEVPVDGLYDYLTAIGYGYGPVFQGLRGAWRLGEEVFAEVALPDGTETAAARFGLHPALLDSALHAMGLSTSHDADGDGGGRNRLPFAWNGVTLYAAGADALRVRITPKDSQDSTGTNGTTSAKGPEGVSLTLADPKGTPVAVIESLVLRTVTSAQLDGARQSTHHDSLFRLGWSPAAVDRTFPDARWAVLGADHLGLAASGVGVDAFAGLDDLAAAPTPPPAVLLAFAPSATDSAASEAVHERTAEALETVQAWLADERFTDVLMVVATRGAVAVAGEDVTDLAQAAVWGLLRSAQSEAPGRFVLVDIDDADVSAQSLVTAVACGEPQLAVRAGEILAPRLDRVAVAEPDAESVADPDAADREDADRDDADRLDTGQGGTVDQPGTVLITGASGFLGGLVARRLAERGARHLLLVSRRGGDAPNAAQLAEELAESGAEVTFAACDTSDRSALAAVLAEIPAAHPLTTVVHAAGIVDDGVLASLTPQRLADVLRPKVDAAWHLHELTKELALREFVLFSSAAGTFGGPGQANYAAANAFLDGLAQHRSAQGLPAVSLAWGPWAESGMAGRMDEADIARMARSGLAPLTQEQGIELFDTGRAAGHAVLMPTRLTAGSPQVRPDAIPPLLRGLIRGPVRPAAAGKSGPTGASAADLKQRLAAADAAERDRILLDILRTAIADVLGHGSPAAVEVTRGFLEIGFDSLTAVELRNRLNAETGLRLPSTLVFDHPSPEALAAHLRDELVEDGATSGLALLAELDRLERALGAVASDDADRAVVTDRLRGLMSAWNGGGTEAEAPGGQDLESATADEIFDLLDEELETS
ncbi:type I polyketide synthase, partial [Streptomyces lomondensis]